MGQFLLIAIGTFLSEDLTCIATGALIASGRMNFVSGVLACLAGIYVGDLLLYFAGRFIGRPILRWKPVRRCLSEESLDRASDWLTSRGAAVVILSRFTPGLRLPTYVAAGLLKTRFWTFSLYFLLAAAIWTPLLVGASAALGTSLPRIAIGGPALLLLGIGLRRLRPNWQTRRRIVGWFRRRGRWEFWPPWLAYLPVLPYLICLAIRHRSLTLFTAANPGIPSGGFVGESKSAILSKLSQAPDYVLLPKTFSTEDRVRTLREFLSSKNLSYPVVLKPDVGERGTGVTIARREQDAAAHIRNDPGDTILQKYVSGLEFGLFYYRYPGERQGHIFSITEKRFPTVEGDGVSTIRNLILKDERAVCLAGLYVERLRRHPNDVPVAGEVVPLAELGSHCRGAVFLNGSHLETERLRESLDRIASGFKGFHFGRFDVRSASIEDLQAGRFEILELNGVTAEATHIYDPAVTVLEAYRVLFRQWSIAFEIGALNRRAGHQPMGVREFSSLLWSNSRPRRSRDAAGLASVPPVSMALWGGRPRPRATPWSRCSSNRSSVVFMGNGPRHRREKKWGCS